MSASSDSPFKHQKCEATVSLAIGPPSTALPPRHLAAQRGADSTPIPGHQDRAPLTRTNRRRLLTDGRKISCLNLYSLITRDRFRSAGRPFHVQRHFRAASCREIKWDVDRQKLFRTQVQGPMKFGIDIDFEIAVRLTCGDCQRQSHVQFSGIIGWTPDLHN